MKNLLVYFAAFTIFCGCKNNTETKEQKAEKAEKAEKTELDKKITKRDVSINKSNAYNDLFLDSMAMESFITQNKLNDTLIRRMRSFYNARNYQFAWFASDGLSEQTMGFCNQLNYYKTYINKNALSDKQLQKKIDAMMQEDSLKINGKDKSIINAELQLTQQFIKYILDTYDKGVVKRKEMERFVPIKKQDAMELADSLLTKKHKDNKYYESANEPYKLLKDQLTRYYSIAKNGGWQPIEGSVKTLKKGASSPVILSIKRRLQVTGEMPGNDTTNIFDDDLEKAVRTFEASRGYTPNGVITAGLIKELNVPVTTYIHKLLINLNRMRWMLTQPEGDLILVNIPEFELHVLDKMNKVFDMGVVVGKEGHNTMMFTGNLNQIVFSPYWNVTPDITRKEILPAMQRNPNYLANNNMEIAGYDNGIPVIRQLPGPDNSLGKVKFLFPNSFNIYFHDTPAKSLFSKDKRAYSHGCIRLSDPVKMANYLLRNQPEWTPEKIDEAMNSGKEQYVKLKKAVPVIISYYTAWVDENRILNFRDDIYKHDKKLENKMFTNEL